jgi:hypothetical protein
MPCRILRYLSSLPKLLNDSFKLNLYRFNDKTTHNVDLDFAMRFFEESSNSSSVLSDILLRTLVFSIPNPGPFPHSSVIPKPASRPLPTRLLPLASQPPALRRQPDPPPHPLHRPLKFPAGRQPHHPRPVAVQHRPAPPLLDDLPSFVGIVEVGHESASRPLGREYGLSGGDDRDCWGL